MRKSLLNLAISIVLMATCSAGAFLWGFQSHRAGIFPYKILQRYAWKAGVTRSPEPVEVQPPELKALQSLGYLQGTVDHQVELTGVTRHEPRLSYPGLNLYNSVSSDQIYIVDMSGKEVFRWRMPSAFWEHSHVLPNGDLLAVQNGKQLIKIDKASNTLWSYQEDVHHSIAVNAEGNIRAIKSANRIAPEIHPTIPIRDDYITTISSEGSEIASFSLADLLLGSEYSFLIPSISHRGFEAALEERGQGIELDILHTNHVEELDGSLLELSQIFKSGNLLISMRNINTIAIIDPAVPKITWLWGPANLTYPHHPTVLENGNVLVFNNGEESSQVLELNPLNLDIVWHYEAPGEFFSKTRGSNQRLSNGNTLITESDPGYVFEVTPAGEIIWEFACPEINADSVRSAIWRMTRLKHSELPFLNRSQEILAPDPADEGH